MILVRPTINLYYDTIVNGVPVPNGVSQYKINKYYFNIPVMSSIEQEKNNQVIKTTYFYNVMKVFNVNVNLFTGKETAPNLFYPLELDRLGTKLTIIDIIPEKTLSKIKKKKMKVLILFQQWIGDYKLMKSLKSRLDNLIRHGVAEEQIYVVIGDVNCTYQEIFRNIKVFGFDWWQVAYQLRYKTRYQSNDFDYHWVSFMLEDLKAPKEEITNEIMSFESWKEPSILFTAFSGTPSAQSLALISELRLRGLLEKGNYEFNTTKNKDVNPDSKFLIDNNGSEEYKILKKKEIDNLMSEVKKINNVKESLENSVFSIILEPFVPKLDKEFLSETHAMWISPNIWKAIAMGHPFIVVGSLSTMRYLNNEGYFSYVDLFNESYDNISNLAIKINRIADEIEKIAKLSKEEINKKIELTKPFVEVNRKKFLEKNHTWKFYDLFTEMRYE